MKNFNKLIEGISVVDVGMTEDFIRDLRKFPDYKVAFDSMTEDTRRGRRVCVHIIDDNLSSFQGMVWYDYISVYVVGIEYGMRISEEDARVPLTEEQKEILIDVLEMLML